MQVFLYEDMAFSV